MSEAAGYKTIRRYFVGTSVMTSSGGIMPMALSGYSYTLEKAQAQLPRFYPTHANLFVASLVQYFDPDSKEQFALWEKAADESRREEAEWL